MRRPLSTPHYITPRIDEKNAPSYDELCDNWARRLPELALRELTSDYMRGIIDESTTDAYEEYRRRERHGLLREQKSAGLSQRTHKK